MPHAPKRGSIPPTGNRTVTSPPTRRAQTFEMETYNGYVRTPADAIKLFEACRLGLLPRVQRRLSEKERQSIRSGSVFVWDEREAGMRRWTDGKSWSASRVSGSFLTYREMEGKRSTGFGTTRRTTAGRSPDVGRLDEEDHDQDGEPEGYRYKTDGLMKQSFSLTTSTGNHLHLISYYSRPQPGEPELRLPSNDPLLQSITPDKAMYPDSSLHESSPPVMTRTPMPSYNSAGPQDQWGSPAWMATPFSTTPNQSPHSAYSNRPEPEISRQPHHLSQLHRQPQYQSPHYQPSQYASSQYPPPAPANHHPSFERLPQPVMHVANGHPSRSPRSQQLQVQAAQAVLIDPRVATAVHTSQGPSLAISVSGRIPSPPRAQSITPPGMASPVIANDVALRRASLSNILLHPAPGSSETNGANPASSNSGSSSPRATVHERSADRLALRSLDRNFCN